MATLSGYLDSESASPERFSITQSHILATMLLVLLILACGSAANTLIASDYFTICKRSDPNFNNCILKTVEDLRPLLKKGSKDLKIPTVEPMVVPRVQVQQGTGPVSIDSTFFDLKVNGISNYKVINVSSNLEKGEIKMTVEIPYLHMQGDYEINGRVLVLPIVGKGDSWSNYTGVSGVMTLKIRPLEKDGVKYYSLQKLSFDIHVKKAIINMNNLFNGNKQLGDAMNMFMSANWEVVFQELKPVVDSAISAILESVATKVFDKFPADQLFPE